MARQIPMRNLGPVVAAVAVVVALLSGIRALVGRYSPATVPNQSISGELVSFEAVRGTLVLRTGNDEQHFVVRPGTPVHDGARTVAPTELAGADGCPAKIRYWEQDGAWVASDVRLSCRQVTGHAPLR